MKKIFSRTLTVIAALVILSLLIWIMGRYGWKLMRFSSCTGADVTYISVSEGQIEIKGRGVSLFPRGCVGTIYQIKDGKCYFGVRFDGLFGFFENSGFDTVIRTNETIKEIYLKTGRNEYLLWDAENDPSVWYADGYSEE